jgi:hypothetical protein
MKKNVLVGGDNGRGWGNGAVVFYVHLGLNFVLLMHASFSASRLFR